MLFFFELFLFVLVMLTLALGEFVSRWLALILWLVVTVFSLIGYVLARQSLNALAAGSSGPSSTETVCTSAEEAELGEDAPAEPSRDLSQPTPIDERWARTLLYNWRRSNVLLVLGALAVGGWYWLAR